MLLAALLTALLLAWAVHLMQTARRRADVLQRVNRELEAQIAERRQVEEALREKETSYRTLTEDLPGIVYRRSLGADHRMQYFNQVSRALTGYTPAELGDDGGPFERLVLAEDKPRVRAALRRALRGQHAFEVEYRIRHRDGETRYLLDRGTLIRGVTGRRCYIDGFIIDITERRRLEKVLQRSETALKALSAELLMAQERERKRLARELHDGIGQALTSIKLRVENTLGIIGKHATKTGRQALQDTLAIIRHTIEDVRRISQDLRPSILDDLGIVPTVSWLCREFRITHAGMQVEMDVGVREDQVPAGLKACIYRLLQEALNNVAKHAKADRVRVSLSVLEDAPAGTIELCIEDNGCGFEAANTLLEDGSRRGFGLVSMRERAELSGGSLQIDARQGHGTRVRVVWLHAPPMASALSAAAWTQTPASDPPLPQQLPISG
jgi:PAS domain S-box-containing protein